MNRQYLGLSGLAMVLVVLHHAIDLQLTWPQGAASPEGLPLYLLIVLHRVGKIAVPLFLFISGAFVAYAARGNPPRLTWQTVLTSLKRLLWPYVIWSVVFYALVYLLMGQSFSPLGYVKNLVVGYPYHFVPLLLFFYLIAPVLVRLARRFGFWLIVAIAVYQAVLINITEPGTWGFQFPAWSGVLAPPVLRSTLAQWGLYFPLGLVVSLQGKRVKDVLRRVQWPLIAAAVIFYLLDVLHVGHVLHMPAAVNLYPLACVLLAPLVPRSAIPRIEWFEEVGKRSYGVYLTHIIVIYLGLFMVHGSSPGLMQLPLLLGAALFVAGLFLPLLLMQTLARLTPRFGWRYVFG